MKKNGLIVWHYSRSILSGCLVGLLSWAATGYAARAVMMDNYSVVDNFLVSTRYWLIPLCMLIGVVYSLIKIGPLKVIEGRRK